MCYINPHFTYLLTSLPEENHLGYVAPWHALLNFANSQLTQEYYQNLNNDSKND